ncbi:MAG: hypothetical protein HRT88_08690 [Lentisphaeraceae bacterium]|nr:hypothetical protein [Lentisphaeraceae bacterium]
MRLTEEHTSEDGCLTNYFGGEFQTPPQTISAPFTKNCKVILSSDGIGYYIGNESMDKAGQNFNWDRQKVADKLMELAIKAGSDDARTIVVASH